MKHKRGVGARGALPFYLLTALNSLGNMIQAEDDLVGFLASCIWCKGKHPVGDQIGDSGRGQPAAGIEFFLRRGGELAEYGEMAATIHGGVLFEQPGALPVQLDLESEPTYPLDNTGFLHVSLAQKGILLEGKADWICPIH